ncbi:MAG: hypothetical protein JNM88_07740 [Chitinophagaceae bacterium]|nr:hypothetical protein [Chitinophagaceae bacterium]
MKQLVYFIFFFLLSNTLSAQQDPGTEEPEVLLKDSVDCTRVKDQGNSPTCWVFGTNSLFESEALRKTGKRLDLSEMFIARYAYIDKANTYLATGGKTYFAGGGQFHDVLRIVRRYGIMPEAAYTGRPEANYSHDHRALDTAMKRFMEDLLAAGKTRLDGEDLQQVTDTLDKYLGRVPVTFIYEGKEYSPRSFADQVVKFSDDYIELMSFADLPMYQKCLLSDKYNWAGDSIYNIPLAELQAAADTALQKGWSVGWEGDVTEPGFNYFSGYARLADSSFVFDKQRVDNYKTEATERDHMLHLVGIGKDKKGEKWYYLKNSWGTWLSHFRGYLYMNSNYFKMKTVIILVNREALPLHLKKKLGLEK